MSDVMIYKGYKGSVSYSDEDKIFVGKVEHIRDLVSYEGANIELLTSGFQEAVDDYLTLRQATA